MAQALVTLFAPAAPVARLLQQNAPQAPYDAATCTPYNSRLSMRTIPPLYTHQLDNQPSGGCWRISDSAECDRSYWVQLRDHKPTPACCDPITKQCSGCGTDGMPKDSNGNTVVPGSVVLCGWDAAAAKCQGEVTNCLAETIRQPPSVGPSDQYGRLPDFLTDPTYNYVEGQNDCPGCTARGTTATSGPLNGQFINWDRLRCDSRCELDKCGGPDCASGLGPHDQVAWQLSASACCLQTIIAAGQMCGTGPCVLPLPPASPPSTSPSPSPSPSLSPSPSPSPVLSPPASPSACSAHPQCAGLAGDCCPTTDGVTLACCSAPPSAPSPVLAACSANPTCASLNLAGDCCPTGQGVRLDCCDGIAPLPTSPVGTVVATGDDNVPAGTLQYGRLTVGEHIWSNKIYQWDVVPSSLAGLQTVQWQDRFPPNGQVTLTPTTAGTYYFFAWGGGRNGNFPTYLAAQGWSDITNVFRDSLRGGSCAPSWCQAPWYFEVFSKPAVANVAEVLPRNQGHGDALLSVAFRPSA